MQKINDDLYKELKNRNEPDLDNILADPGVDKIWVSKKGRLMFTTTDGRVFPLNAYSKNKGFQDFFGIPFESVGDMLPISKYISECRITPSKKRKFHIEIIPKESAVFTVSGNFKIAKQNKDIETCIYEICSGCEILLNENGKILLIKLAGLIKDDLAVYGLGIEDIEKTSGLLLADGEKKKLIEFLADEGRSKKTKKVKKIKCAYEKNGRISFTYLNHKVSYDIETGDLTCDHIVRKKVLDSIKLLEDISVLEKCGRKHKTEAKVTSATSASVTATFKIRRKQVSGKIKRPVKEDVVAEFITKSREDLIRKEKEQEVTIRELKKKNIWTCEAYTIAKLVNRNQHITKNGIIQIMRELKIKSYYPLKFDECDRIYSMLTTEYLNDEIVRLIDSDVLKEKKMTGKYGDYYRIIPGRFFQDFQKAKPDFEERLENILHDENPVPGLLGMPGLVCAYHEKCRGILSGIPSAQLEIYLELKRKALREDKQAVATIKTLQTMLKKN